MRYLLLSTAVLLAGARAGATTHYTYWDGDSGDWGSTYDHWDGGDKWKNNGEVVLGGIPGTLTLQQDVKAKSIQFTVSGYAVAGAHQLEVRDSITLTASVAGATISATMLLGGPQAWEVVDAGAMLTVGSVNLNTYALSVGGAGDVTLTSGLTGLGSLAKSGPGTLWLTGATSHTGATSVTDGTLAVTGTATSSHITVGVEGRLVGTGTVGTLTMASGGILSPGLSVGTLTAGNVTWQGGGYYNWQVADAAGPAGTGYDQLVSAGALTIESTTLNRFKVNLWSLAGLVDGPAANFDPHSAYAWNIATFGSVSGFDADRFLIVRGPSEGTGGFVPENGGAFSLSSDGAHITLHYTPNAEPVWIDATGDWSDGAKWLGGVAPAEGAAVVFAGTGGTATNDGYLDSVAGIRFSGVAAGSYVVDGSALDLGAAGIVNESARAQTVAVDLTLAANTVIVTHTAPLILTGDIATDGHVLVVDGDYGTDISGDISGDGSLYKLDHGRLTLSGANTYVGGTEVTVGDLIVDGSIVGAVVIRDRGLLGGTGSISGGLSVAGTLAPGDSPGILTQLTGDTALLTGSRFVAELGGVTPGTGDGHHDQFDILAGRCVIQVGVTLEALGWDDALGADYLPKRGDVFTVIRTSGGIVDVFDDLTNDEGSNRILFDNNTDHAHLYGNLYGTGLAGAQTLAAYASTANQAAFATALDRAAIIASNSSTIDHPAGFINSAEVEGRVVLAVLKGEDYDTYLPEPYLGVTDHALTSLRAAVDSFLARQTRSLPGTWSFSLIQGHLGYVRTGGSSPSFDRSHAASNSLLGATCDLGPSTTLGFFVGVNDGRFTTRHSRTDLGGSVHGVTFVHRLADVHPTVLKACLAWANLDFTTVRSMNLGDSGDSEIVLSGASSIARDVPLTAFAIQATADIQLAQGPGYELTGMVGFLRGRSTLGAFAEAGGGANLSVSVEPDETSRGTLGLSLAYVPTLETSFVLTAAWEREMGDPGTRLSAQIAGEDFAVQDSFFARDTGLLGLTFAQQYSGQVSLQFSAEFRFNRDASNDRRYNLSVTKRF